MRAVGTAAELERQGWSRVEGIVPAELCVGLLDALRDDLGVPLDDPFRWPEYGPWDIVPMWGHQAQWDIRQHPDLHRTWSSLWGTAALWVSLDMVRFTPPWEPGYLEPLPIHWDHNPHDDSLRWIQGVVALTETELGQGGFRCVPSLFHDHDAWPTEPVRREWGDEWNPDVPGREIVEVPAGAGDLIVWDSRLPHANSRNTSERPRIAFYVQMFPARAEADDAALRVDLWRTGRCHPVWRWRQGCDRIEPWPPASLTTLGRRLLGIERWSA
jgi:hypothetical protein